MRKYFEPAREYTHAAGVVDVAPDDITITVAATGAVVEAGVAYATDADGDAYVETTDALYTHGAKYYLTTTTTTSLGVRTKDHPFEHVMPSGYIPDTTGPGAPEIGDPSAGEESATVVVTPPDDSDYSTTTVYAIPVLGGDTQSASGTSGVITITGLIPGVLYVFVAVAQDTSGNLSAVSNAKVATTLPATDIDRPAYLKWFVNDEDEQHEHGPEVFDPSRGGSLRFFDLGRGRTWSFMLECHEPVWFGTRGIGGRMTVPEGEPGGLRDDRGT